MKVKVEILTDGQARISGLRLENALMGRGFHWQRVYALELPEDAVVLSLTPLVVEMPIESYLRSVVASEMNPQAPAEFLKAHAVVSRSWVAGKIEGRHIDTEVPDGGRNCGEIREWEDTAAHVGFHVCNDDHCQRFQGVRPLAAQVRRALCETEGLVLTDADGRVADARFSKCCGGITERFSTCWQDVDYSYLSSVHDPWCDPAHLSSALLGRILKGYDVGTDFYRWKRTVRTDGIERRLRERFNRSVGRVTALEALDRGMSGRIFRLKIIGTEGELTIGKELTIRRLLDDTCLLSSAFDIEKVKDGFLLRGRGWGHGVGMCQIGAAAMAAAGYGFREILQFYYPGTQLAYGG